MIMMTVMKMMAVMMTMVWAVAVVVVAHPVVATFVWVNTQFDDEKDDDGVSQGANNICSGWILH